MKKFYLYAIIIVAMMIGISSCARRAEAQTPSTTQVADTTKEQSSNHNIDRGTKTQYNDTIAGKVYPVFLSAKGKAFVWRTSKNTGKEYKMYRPEIGKRINPQAYK